MVILITGVSGWIGRKVCSNLCARGHYVIGCDLIPTDGPWHKFVPLDITKSLSFSEKFVTIDLVIHCAGYAHRTFETFKDQRMFYSVNVDGTKHTLEWCKYHGVKRFLYLSSISFYDWGATNDLLSNNMNLSVREEHPMTFSSHYSKSKYQGECLVTNSLLDWRVVRLATVFGDGDRANFSRLARAMKKRHFIIPGKGEAQKSIISVEHAAELITRFALMDKPPYKLINVAMPEAPSLAELCMAYHDICGFPIAPMIPIRIARILGVCGDIAAKILGDFPFTTKTLNKLTTNTVVSVEKMQECFSNVDFGSFADNLKKCSEYYKAL